VEVGVRGEEVLIQETVRFTRDAVPPADAVSEFGGAVEDEL
jgi:hypothetical protein